MSFLKTLLSQDDCESWGHALVQKPVLKPVPVVLTDVLLQLAGAGRLHPKSLISILAGSGRDIIYQILISNNHSTYIIIYNKQVRSFSSMFVEFHSTIPMDDGIIWYHLVWRMIGSFWTKDWRIREAQD